jgi:hypothetical protein
MNFKETLRKLNLKKFRDLELVVRCGLYQMDKVLNKSKIRLKVGLIILS